MVYIWKNNYAAMSYVQLNLDTSYLKEKKLGVSDNFECGSNLAKRDLKVV